MIDLKEIDKTIELWNNIPNNPLTWDEDEVDFTEDDFGISTTNSDKILIHCYYFRYSDLWNGMKTPGKSIVCPEIHCFVEGGRL